MRISRDKMFMDMARAAAQRSTCFRLNVGAVAVDMGYNVISIGYNGPPSGEPHCSGVTCEQNGVCVRAVHAEHNVLTRALGRVWDIHTIYVTHSPCEACARLMLRTADISRVVFEEPYRIVAPIEILDNCGIEVHRLLPSGQIMDAISREIRNDL